VGTERRRIVGRRDKIRPCGPSCYKTMRGTRYCRPGANVRIVAAHSHRIEHADRPVQNAQRTFDFDREVHVARRIDNIDAILLLKRSQEAVVAADVIVMPRSRSAPSSPWGCAFIHRTVL